MSSESLKPLPEVPLKWTDFSWSLEKLRHKPYGKKTRERYVGVGSRMRTQIIMFVGIVKLCTLFSHIGPVCKIKEMETIIRNVNKVPKK